MKRALALALRLATLAVLALAIGCGDSSPPPFTTCDSGVPPPRPDTGSPDVTVPSEGGLPPIDGAFALDVYTSDCPGGNLTNVFVVTEQNTLYSFAPTTAAFTKIGTLNCPAMNGATPFSMAVSRQGVAYVLFSDGSLFRVSTIDASCSATAFQPGQLGFTQFGMGYTTDHLGPAETI
jgi:hypothetical protein